MKKLKEYLSFERYKIRNHMVDVLTKNGLDKCYRVEVLAPVEKLVRVSFTIRPSISTPPNAEQQKRFQSILQNLADEKAIQEERIAAPVLGNRCLPLTVIYGCNLEVLEKFQQTCLQATVSVIEKNEEEFEEEKTNLKAKKSAHNSPHRKFHSSPTRFFTAYRSLVLDLNLQKTIAVVDNQFKNYLKIQRIPSAKPLPDSLVELLRFLKQIAKHPQANNRKIAVALRFVSEFVSEERCEETRFQNLSPYLLGIFLEQMREHYEPEPILMKEKKELKAILPPLSPSLEQFLSQWSEEELAASHPALNPC